MGVLLGLVNYVQLVVRFPGQEMLCLTVVLSLLATVMLAKTIGCVLPIVAQVLHLDPAIMAAPLITTIVDAVSLIIYFQLACSCLKSRECPGPESCLYTGFGLFWLIPAL